MTSIIGLTVARDVGKEWINECEEMTKTGARCKMQGARCKQNLASLDFVLPLAPCPLPLAPCPLPLAPCPLNLEPCPLSDQTKMVVTNTTPGKALNSAMDKETANAMRAFIEKVAGNYDLVGAILFGSRARKTHRSDSDADVAVLLHGTR